MVLFTQKFVIKLSKFGFGIRDPGSEIRDPGKTYNGSRIQGQKAPDTGSATLYTRYNYFKLNMIIHSFHVEWISSLYLGVLRRESWIRDEKFGVRLREI